MRGRKGKDEREGEGSERDLGKGKEGGGVKGVVK